MKPVARTVLALLFAAAAAAPALAQQAQTPPPAQFQLPSNWEARSISPDSSSLGPALTQRNLAPMAHVSRVRPVPEPSQWALMATGMGLVAWIVRRRSKRNPD